MYKDIRTLSIAILYANSSIARLSYKFKLEKGHNRLAHFGIKFAQPTKNL